jgi:hypothetical protein
VERRFSASDEMSLSKGQNRCVQLGTRDGISDSSVDARGTI